MNYYAKGGQAHGLSTLKGHEIRMKDGMPAFGLGGWFQSNVVKPVSNAVTGGVKAIQNIPGIKQVSDVATQAVKPIDQALVGLDKTVGKAIPGGWGTVAQVAGSAMGVPTPLMVGLGALNGSGVMHKGSGFNMQGALMGGATAYAMSELGDYMRSAAPVDGIAGVTPAPTVDAAGNLVNAATGEVGSGLAGNASGMLVDPSTLNSGNIAALNSLSAPMEAGLGAGLQVAPPPSIGSQILSGNWGDALTQAGQNISQSASNVATSAQEGIANLGTKASNLYDTATTPSTYTEALDKGMANAQQTGAGLKNLVGLGDMTSKEAVKLAGASGINPMTMGAATVYGMGSLADLDAQKAALNDQLASNNISQQEYNAAMAEITRSEGIARNAVAANPFNTNPDRSASIGDTSYARNSSDENLYGRNTNNLYDQLAPPPTTYAKGGDVKGYFGGGMLIQGLVDKLNPTTAAPAPADPGFQNLKSEGTPSTAGGLAGIAQAVGNMVDSSRFANKPIDLGITLYDKRHPNENVYDRFVNKKYAYGGSVDDEPGTDDLSMAMGGVAGYAAGGQPRFLSGGGDGLSDDIPATIGGDQPAKLADGEFIIPSDVVSNLGNGSSKAGAQKLYAMLDRVRQQAHGTKKQISKVNANKVLPA